MENTGKFIERSNEIAKLKELTKATFEDAVKRAVEAEKRAASFRKRAAELAQLVRQLSTLAYTYASEHSMALTTPLHDIKDETKQGEVTFDDGATYSLTVGVGDPKRIDGSNITEAFKQTLPKGWVKTKLDLSIETIKAAEPSEREEYGLVCQPKPTWRQRIS